MEFEKLKEGQKVHANTPYLIRAKSTGAKSIVVNSTSLYAAKTEPFEYGSNGLKAVFKGTYTGIDGQTMYDEKYYGMSSGALCYAANNTVTLSSYRWYLTIEDEQGSLARRNASFEVRVRVTGNEWNVDGINSTPASCDASNDVYTLDGRRVTDASRLKGGIYIKNGKKLVK
jgi:hypothetical protein